jgi:hypothetical protein
MEKESGKKNGLCTNTRTHTEKTTQPPHHEPISIDTLNKYTSFRTNSFFSASVCVFFFRMNMFSIEKNNCETYLVFFPVYPKEK